MDVNEDQVRAENLPLWRRFNKAYTNCVRSRGDWRYASRASVLAKVIEAVTSGGGCHYCHRPLEMTGGSPATLTIDHALPISRGGDTSIGNLLITCTACNDLKGAMTAATYREMLSNPGPLSANQALLAKIFEEKRPRGKLSQVLSLWPGLTERERLADIRTIRKRHAKAKIAPAEGFGDA